MELSALVTAERTLELVAVVIVYLPDLWIGKHFVTHQ